MAKMKKAQAGTALDSYKKAPKKSGAALTEMGKKTTKAAINKRTDAMAKSLDKASVLGKKYVSPSDSIKKARPMGMNFDKKSFDKVPSYDEYIKKTENKKVAPKKKMQYGGEAASMVPSMKKGGSMKKGVSVKKTGMKKKK